MTTAAAPLDLHALRTGLTEVLAALLPPSTPVVLWVDGNPHEAVRLEHDPDVGVLFVHARREVGWGDRLSGVDHDTLPADDWRRHNSSSVRGALGWALYAAATGDEEGGTWEAARDALGHDVARELERVLAVAHAHRDDDEPPVDYLAQARATGQPVTSPRTGRTYR